MQNNHQHHTQAKELKNHALRKRKRDFQLVCLAFHDFRGMGLKISLSFPPGQPVQLRPKKRKVERSPVFVKIKILTILTLLKILKFSLFFTFLKIFQIFSLPQGRKSAKTEKTYTKNDTNACEPTEGDAARVQPGGRMCSTSNNYAREGGACLTELTHVSKGVPTCLQGGLERP